MIAEGTDHSIRNTSHTYLECGSIRYKFGYIVTDFYFLVGRNRRRHLHQRFINLHGSCKLR